MITRLGKHISYPDSPIRVATPAPVFLLLPVSKPGGVFSMVELGLVVYIVGIQDPLSESLCPPVLHRDWCECLCYGKFGSGGSHKKLKAIEFARVCYITRGLLY